MKTWFIVCLVLSLLLTACSAVENPQPERSSRIDERSRLPDLGEAPELTNDVWLNTDTTLRLADLRGKVVVLDMWTFG